VEKKKKKERVEAISTHQAGFRDEKMFVRGKEEEERES